MQRGEDRKMADYGELRLFSGAQCLVVWVLTCVVCWLIARIPVPFFKRIVE